MLVKQELIWHLYRKDGVFSFWLSALVENNEAIALSLAGAASGYYQRVTAGRYPFPNIVLIKLEFLEHIPGAL